MHKTVALLASLCLAFAALAAPASSESVERLLALTQEEVDGLIAFYESPAGQAYIAKMPAVAQKSMAPMQNPMIPMIRKLQASAEEFVKGSDK